MKQAVQLVLRCYQRVISPMLPHSCRFVPTCSQYAIEAVECHGVVRGGLLAGSRLLRCHPFARAGVDLVPLARVKSGRGLADILPGNSRSLNGT
jgi:putative membrane protein insertion efficiency factor